MSLSLAGSTSKFQQQQASHHHSQFSHHQFVNGANVITSSAAAASSLVAAASSSSAGGTSAGGAGVNQFYSQHPGRDSAIHKHLPPPATPFLDLKQLELILARAAADLHLLSDNSTNAGSSTSAAGNSFSINNTDSGGLRSVADPAVLKLISLACEDWIKEIIYTAVILSRHRRRSRNTGAHSELSKALRQLAQRDKDREYQRVAQKLTASNGSGTGSGGSGGDGSGGKDDDKKGAGGGAGAALSEESQYKAANATALMMTSGKKKYSWMVGGGAGAGGAGAGKDGHDRSRGSLGGAGNQRSDGGIRYREAREEQGLVLRDLLGAMEEQRVGVEKALQKGYARLRN
ncbi:hypothetical protein D0Z03_000129 [Geotrichum reessii]|nr:hypothetical protein D0Z03_000129 [Galactomyces reessii]